MLNVIVHCPKTDQGYARLQKAVADVHIQKIISKINSMTCPTEQKIKIIDHVKCVSLTKNNG